MMWDRFDDKNWGFSAVLLATGAWRDRPLPIAKDFEMAQRVRQKIFDQEVANADEKVDRIVDHLSGEKLLSPEKIAAIYEQLRKFQKKTGYNGDYDHWIKNNLPVRLENLISRN